MSQQISKIIGSSSVAIKNGQSSEVISKAIAKFGYTHEVMQVGELLLIKANELIAFQNKASGHKLGASVNKTTAFNKANTMYIPHILIARIGFKKDKGAYEALELDGTRKRDISGWLVQAKTFYTNMQGNTKYKAKMGKYGITPKKLTDAFNLIDKAENAWATYKTEAGRAINATKNRDLALAELKNWTSDFLAIARIALADNIQLMEVLGVVVPS